MPLVLVIPDLLALANAPDDVRSLRLPALERWLARADASRPPARGLHALLAAEYGLASPPPIAAIAMAGEERPRTGSWLRADPVHLRIGQDAVALHDASILDVTRDEANALVEALDAHFRDDGLEFYAASADRWYVRVPDGEMPRTTPLPEALGRNVFGLLPRGTGRINWRAAITEAQMMLSGHAVNASREAQGKPAINSVWFWGEGPVSPALSAAFAAVYANDAFARGLAQLSGVRALPVPPMLDQVDLEAKGASVLVVEDSLSALLHRGDIDGWRAKAEELDRDWFVPLPRALERFGGMRIALPASGDTCLFTLQPGARWRLFRSRKPLAAHA